MISQTWEQTEVGGFEATRVSPPAHKGRTWNTSLLKTTSWVAIDTVQTFKNISTLSLASYLNFYSQFKKQKSGETQSTDKAKALYLTSVVPSVRLVSMETDGVPFTPFLRQCSVLRVFKVIATRIRGKSKQTLKLPSIERGTSWLRQPRTNQLSHAYSYPCR